MKSTFLKQALIGTLEAWLNAAKENIENITTIETKKAVDELGGILRDFEYRFEKQEDNE